jgi:hypothetical protein
LAFFNMCGSINWYCVFHVCSRNCSGGMRANLTSDLLCR